MPADRDSYWLSMPGATKGTFGFVRVTDSGGIEIELCERVDAGRTNARQVSTIYAVAPSHVVSLAQQLALGFGGPVPDVGELPDRLSTFLDVHCLIEWLTKHSGAVVLMRVETGT